MTANGAFLRYRGEDLAAIGFLSVSGLRPASVFVMKPSTGICLRNLSFKQIDYHGNLVYEMAMKIRKTKTNKDIEYVCPFTFPFSQDGRFAAVFCR
ncbi:hypothetical protein M3Y96_00045700 [Aphelenchoides besseyi]|nr:hypothetical protein M3Y96_00045700 [Aphelenchoides besseyi]